MYTYQEQMSRSFTYTKQIVQFFSLLTSIFHKCRCSCLSTPWTTLLIFLNCYSFFNDFATTQGWSRTTLITWSFWIELTCEELNFTYSLLTLTPEWPKPPLQGVDLIKVSQGLWLLRHSHANLEPGTYRKRVWWLNYYANAAQNY